MKLRVITLLIGFFALLLSVYPFIYNLVTPVSPGRINLYWDNWPYDFTYYRSIITQGKNGRLTTIDKYTSEKYSGKFIRSSYIILGHISRLLNTDETFIYHLARVLGGAFFIFISYKLISFTLSSVLPVKKINLSVFFALILYLFAAGIPGQVCDPICRNIPRLGWMTQLDPIRRLTFLPHYLWGQIAFIFALWCFINDRLIKQRLYIFLSGIILGLAGLDHPPSLGLIYPLLIVALLSMIWKALWQKNNRNNNIKGYLINTLILFTGTLPFLVYLFWSTNQPPWSLTRNAEFSLGTNFINFMLAVGPTYMIGLITGVIVLLTPKRMPTPLIFNAGWIVLTALLSFFASKFGLFAQTRFLQIAIQLPAAILTIYAFVSLGKIARSNLKIPILKRDSLIMISGSLVILCVTAQTNYLLYKEQLNYIYSMSKQALSTIPYPPYIDNPPIPWIQSMYWLSKNSKPEDVVLSDFTAGNFIPTYSGNTVYFGHEIETADFGNKKQDVINFFLTSNPQKQLRFLKDNHIDYIFYGPQEKAYQKNQLGIPGIKKVFENSLVTIYKVE